VLTSWMLSIALIGVVPALAAVTAIVAIVATVRRYHQRARQIMAGDYLVRWDYTQGEWEQFVALEHRRSLRVSLLFLPLTLGLAALLLLFSRVLDDPLLTGSVPSLLVVAGGFCVILIYSLTGRRGSARRTRWGKTSYLSPLGIVRPDGYRPLRGRYYHVSTASILPGRPSVLCFRLRLGRVGSLLAGLGNIPAQFEIRVPVPHNHEAEAAQVAAELLRRDS
jgi:hypothetical protein